MSDDFRRVVREGYEQLGARYWEWSRANDPRYRERYVAFLEEQLASGSLVVELGSGSGEPTARLLSRRHRVICVDVARTQLDLVGRTVPDAKRVVSDMSSIAFRPESIDAVVAFYSIIHVPRNDQAPLFRSIAQWLKPGGVFVASLGTSDNPADRDDWIDNVPMVWSSFPPETNRTNLVEASFELLRDEILENFEDERTVRFQWVLARKP